MVITCRELNSPNDNEQNDINGVFVNKQLSNLNTYSGSVKSSETKNHRVKGNKNVGRKTHGQDQVTRWLIVGGVQILEVFLVLVEPNNADKESTDEPA